MSNNGNSCYKDVLIVKISWGMVSCFGLAFGTEKSKLKVKILRHSRPNLTAFFARQSRNC